jgi:hypothetical protein
MTLAKAKASATKTFIAQASLMIVTYNCFVQLGFSMKLTHSSPVQLIHSELRLGLYTQLSWREAALIKC